jgi:hypothetical protein
MLLRVATPSVRESADRMKSRTVTPLVRDSSQSVSGRSMTVSHRGDLNGWP